MTRFCFVYFSFEIKAACYKIKRGSTRSFLFVLSSLYPKKYNSLPQTVFFSKCTESGECVSFVHEGKKKNINIYIVKKRKERRDITPLMLPHFAITFLAQ